LHDQLAAPQVDSESYRTQEDRVPPRYEIRVAGDAGDRIAEFSGQLEVVADGPVTVLRGELDQAGLHGVLERVRALGLDLIDVRRARPPRERID
jgi:hypothetical protein